ncbi:IS3 family transposase [Streptomyces heilongjiangensis]|uniref:IS3 family transposase n=1 Tax=Streptomyces heilongjiangensis TaxID=945052 RepID=A0ABW1BIU0_9ACTN|nr:IS3 family transposase [Streptomyces heilongjiangensis]MDC2951970.1 IS3 family transposase [Streptomyces heilongjiangensis]
MSEICRFIHAEKANFTVVLLCKLMKTARSAYYAWVAGAGAGAREARRRADEALAHQITVIHIASRRNYGVPRVTAELRRQGRVVNHKRVARVMRENNIVGNGRRTGRRSLTRADTKAAPSPDLIGRDFTAARPGTKIVGDITYIPTAEGWLYLASWLDLATREIIGYSMADHHRADLVVDALDMAAALGRLEPGSVIHSDRGSEYTSGQLQDRMRELGHRQSMGRTGSCFDNAAAGSFWAVLKEEIGTRFWPDRATARADIFDFVDPFYNRRRLRKHIHWGYLTPRETRLRYRRDQGLAA